MRPRLLPALAAVLLVAGCASHVKETTLQSTLDAYAGTIRWGDIASAARFVDPEVLEAHPPGELQLARYQHIRISGYDTEGPVPVGDNEVHQRVTLGVINIHTQRQRSVIDEQVWQYNPETERWWLESGLPDITQ